jgi:hypothetical protein
MGRVRRAPTLHHSRSFSPAEVTIREQALFLRVSLEERTGENAASGVREHREEKSG